MIHFFACPDPGLLLDRLGSFVKGDPSRSCDGKNGFSMEDRANLATGDLLGRGFVLVIRNAQDLGKSDLETVTSMTGFATGKRVALCLEGKGNGAEPDIPSILLSLPGYNEALADGRVWRQSGLTESTMVPFIETKAREAGLEMPKDVAGKLASMLAPDAGNISMEIAKLSVSCEKTVSSKDLDVVVRTRTPDFFDMLDRARSGDLAMFWDEVVRDRQSGNGLLMKTVAIMGREAMSLLCVKMGKTEGVAAFILKKRRETANSMSIAAIEDVILACEKAETALKSGAVREGDILEIFGADLQNAFGK